MKSGSYSKYTEDLLIKRNTFSVSETFSIFYNFEIPIDGTLSYLLYFFFLQILIRGSQKRFFVHLNSNAAKKRSLTFMYIKARRLNGDTDVKGKR